MNERSARNIIVGQAVDSGRLAFASHLRREMTREERILRANRFHGLRFRRQQVIDGYIVDFYCHGLRLVLEVDGEVHSRQQEYDIQRDAVLTSRGLTILRVSNDAVHDDLNSILSEVEALLLGSGHAAESDGA